MRSVRSYNDSKEQTEIGSNFWISFTDIMSCLLLIFLFLLTINLVSAQADSATPEAMRAKIHELSEKVDILEQENNQLWADSKELKNKKRELAELKEKLATIEEANERLAAENRRIVSEYGAYDAYDSAEKKLIDSIEKLTEEINRNLDDEKWVTFDKTSKTIHIPESLIRFEKGKSDLPQDLETRRFIANLSFKLFRHLITLREQSLVDSVFIEGHTDSDPVRSDPEKGNWKLSSERAINFWLALDKNKNLSKLQNSDGAKLFSVSGYADSRPHECSRDGRSYGTADCNWDKLTKIQSDSLKRRIDIRFNTYHKGLR